MICLLRLAFKCNLVVGILFTKNIPRIFNRVAYIWLINLVKIVLMASSFQEDSLDPFPGEDLKYIFGGQWA